MTGLMALLLGMSTAVALPDIAVTPDHPLYDTKTAVEGEVEELAPNETEAVEAKLEHAGKRANESNLMAEENETELANQTANEYAEKMQEVNDLGKQVSDLAQQRKIDELVATATLHHAEVLSAVYERVPEQAKAGIERALNSSVKGHNSAVKAMQERGQSTAGMNISSRIPADVRQKTGIGRPENVPAGGQGGGQNASQNGGGNGSAQGGGPGNQGGG